MWASALQACAPPQQQQLLAALTTQLKLHQAKPGMLVIKAAASRQCRTPNKNEHRTATPYNPAQTEPEAQENPRSWTGTGDV
jgi:hypothetical protein